MWVVLGWGRQESCRYGAVPVMGSEVSAGADVLTLLH